MAVHDEATISNGSDVADDAAKLTFHDDAAKQTFHDDAAKLTFHNDAAKLTFHDDAAKQTFHDDDDDDDDSLLNDSVIDEEELDLDTEDVRLLSLPSLPSGPSKHTVGTRRRNRRSKRSRTPGRAEAGSPTGRGALWKGKRWLFCVALLAVILAVGTFTLRRSHPSSSHSTPADSASSESDDTPATSAYDSAYYYPAPRGGTTRSWQASYAKAAKLVRSMSLPAKINVTTGTGWMTQLCVGNTGPATSTDSTSATTDGTTTAFPALCLQDGPLGPRFADNVTLWPAGISTAATWNKELIYDRGRAMGLEFRGKGINVLLGPCVGPLGRMPGGGRNFEGFGPDPVLAGAAAAQTIRGIQDVGVMATIKHYIGNEQEHFRSAGGEWGLGQALSVNMDDRTLHEVYAWPFQDSVKAGVASVMCSYNKFNSSYTCGNSKLLNGILKDEFGFQGFVQSDWLAQRDGVASALAGLDMSMPGDGPYWQDANSFWGANLTRAVLNGTVPLERVDDMVTRIVAAWYQFGQDDAKQWPRNSALGSPNFSSWTNDARGRVHPATDDTTEEIVNHFVDVQGAGKPGIEDHRTLAQQIAAEAVVLVKNEGGILPLNKHALSNGRKPTVEKQRAVGVFGEDAGAVDDPNWPNHCHDRGCNKGTLAVGWGSGTAEFPFLDTPVDALRDEFDNNNIKFAAHLTNSVKPSDVAGSDLCFVFVSSDAGEAFVSWEGVTDRIDLKAQKGGDALVLAVADQCPQTIVVVHAVGPVVVEAWANHSNVKAILLAQLPGERSGPALADVVFGRVDASGRLPYTVGKSLADYGPSGQILTTPVPKDAPQQNYDEGLLIDYRHFDHNDVQPRYEFGFGLSYTTWRFDKLKLTTLRAQSAMPAPRPVAGATPPTYPTDIPARSTAEYPAGFKSIKKYIYPYLEAHESLSDPAGSKASYPYPPGYSTSQTPSSAGGDEGGNPDLYTVHIAVTVDVTNTGTRLGSQVVQLYLSCPSDVTDGSEKVDFPLRVLRGFEKVVDLKPGATTTVSLNLTRRDLSYWSARQQNWIMPTSAGKSEADSFTVSVGTSSRNLPLSAIW